MKASKEDPPLGSALLPPSDRSSFKETLDTFASLGGMAPSFVPFFLSVKILGWFFLLLWVESCDQILWNNTILCTVSKGPPNRWNMIIKYLDQKCARSAREMAGELGSKLSCVIQVSEKTEAKSRKSTASSLIGWTSLRRTSTPMTS